MRLNKPIVAVSTAALFALAACGGGGTDGSTGDGDQTEPTFKEGGGTGQGKDPTRSEGPAEPIEGAQEGGTVKVISFSGLETMDPTEAYYTNTAAILQGLVVRSLTQYVYDQETGDMVLIPDLATDLGRPNDDFTEWTFTIRDGVKYENGQEVTAEDVAYGIKRSMDRQTFPNGAPYSNEYFLDGDKYKGPYRSGTDYDGVVVDGMDLTIKMATPFADMPYWGAFPAISPIPPGKASDPAKYALHPLATGPYKFAEYTPQKALTLVKNDQWDPDTDPGRHQYVDGYEMRFDVESAKIDQIMLKDEGDAKNTLSNDSVTVANYLKFKEESPDRLVLGSNPCTFYWAPDYREVTDKKVRQAIAYAYPYLDAYAAGGRIEGVTRIPGTNIMPPGIPGREEYNPLPDHEPGSTDPDKARQLLEEADAVGYELKWLYATDDPLSVDVKDTVKAALEDAGFKASPVATTLDQFTTVQDDLNSDINIRSAGWCSDWPSGASWFPVILQSTNLKEEGIGLNYSVFSEKAIDKEIKQIQTLSLEDQPAAWNELDQKILEDYFPIIVLAYGGEAQMRGSNVNGFNIDPTFGEPTWKDIWLSQ